MDKDRIEILIKKLESGEILPDEMKELEEALEHEEILLTDFPKLSFLADKLKKLEVPEPGSHLRESFYNMLEKEKSGKRKNLLDGLSVWLENSGWSRVNIKLAYSLVLVITGIGIGLWISPQNTSNSEIQNLTSEVQQMKELMMFSLLENSSATDRLKAVNISVNLKKADKKVIDALVKTLKNDENVNVRLATVEALYHYAEYPEARKGLVESIAYQDSPMVQIALAEAMVALREKRSVEELKHLLQKEHLEEGVKEKVKESIDILS